MKKLSLLVLLSAFAFAAGAQKTINDPNAEVRAVGSFHAIRVSSGIDLYLSQGDEAVAVSAKDAATTKQIKVEVENGVLKIGFDWKDRMVFSNGKQLKAYVSYKQIDLLSASGGSDVMVDGTVKAPNLTINLSGGSDFKGRVESQTLRIDASGGSDLNIAGTTGSVKIDASGGSDVHGYDLVADSCSADASGGSDIHVTVNKDLRAEASGGSDVFYKGSATSINVSKSGGGSVKKTG
ncbi:MAG: hypothetical protein JWP27_427 [Flaviaesturariibacter sp.]|nr:hypothetical protein [Flaviaesturariibacter sp.]